MGESFAVILKSLFGNKEAFGLPAGTVRGFVFVLMTMYVCSGDLPLELYPIYGGVVGFYFGQKTAKKNVE